MFKTHLTSDLFNTRSVLRTLIAAWVALALPQDVVIAATSTSLGSRNAVIMAKASSAPPSESIITLLLTLEMEGVRHAVASRRMRVTNRDMTALKL